MCYIPGLYLPRMLLIVHSFAPIRRPDCGTIPKTLDLTHGLTRVPSLLDAQYQRYDGIGLNRRPARQRLGIGRTGQQIIAAICRLLLRVSYD